MGAVYLGHDTRLGRQVAIKVVGSSAAGSESAYRRLLREARTASSLNHPNICTIHEVGEEDGRVFIVMELLEGVPLREAARAGLPPETVLRYGLQIADALAHAHGRGIVHRDLKSANVMITRDGRAKIVDFGLASHAAPATAADVTRSADTVEGSGSIAGTLLYMAPEVLRGEPADARSDIWALGVMLYEAAAGHLPFEGKTSFDVSGAILRGQPRDLPSRVPAPLVAVIYRCIEKDPAQRYQSAAEVRAALEAIATGAGRSRLPISRSVIAVAAGVVLLLLIAGLVVFRLNRSRSGDSRPAAATGAPIVRSIAVLPLANLSGDAAQDYFADGLTQALISSLARVKSLRVISRTSVMRYKGTSKTVPEIARELGIDAVVEGSVARFGDRVRVTAQLIQAATEKHLWSEEYDREVRDVLAMQSEIARAVALRVQAQLSPQEKATLAAARPIDPAAYDAFLRGSFYSRHENRQNNETAIRLLEEAVSRDPTFATAHAELAHAYVRRFFYFTPDEKQWQDKALAAVQKALELDPSSADALLARGMLLWTPANGFPHLEAIRAHRQALALNPSLDEAHHQLGLVYMHVGLLPEAEQASQAAVALNPANTMARYRVAVTRLYRGEYQDSLKSFRGIASEFNPSLVAFQNAWALLHLERRQEAWAAVRDFLKTNPKDEGGALTSIAALLLAMEDKNAQAESTIRRAHKIGEGFGHFHHTALTIACAYAVMNRKQEALRWLEETARQGFPCRPLFLNEPLLANVRNEPAFQELMARLKVQEDEVRAVASAGGS